MNDSALAIVVIGWMLCGIAASVIAYKKGLNGAAYLFVGMLLGIVGVLVAAAAPARHPMAAVPGWYPDPWQQTTWRWFDGYQWTGHVN
jgi:hypothetical protein